MIRQLHSLLITGSTIALTAGFTPALAQPTPGTSQRCLDWTKLNLSTQQSQRIKQLESDWKSKYARVQPQIIEMQRKLDRMLPDPKVDPIEVMATQQNLARMKEQLRNDATTNYLQKRNVLNETQQRQLEAMIQQMVTDRRRANSAAMQGEQSPGLMNIVNKIKWAIEPH